MTLNNFSMRVISGLIIASGAYCYIYLASEIVFILISAALIIIAEYEFSQALIKKGVPVGLYTSWLLSILFLTSFLTVWKGMNLAAMISVASIAATGAYLFFGRGAKSLFWHFLSLLWIASPVILLIWLRFGGYYSSASDMILFLIVVVSFNDIFAYVGGKKFGRHKLAPVISPKKTVEGSLFGLAAGLIAGFILGSFCLMLSVSYWKLLAISTAVIVCSQAGDLLESMFKRYCQVKDSSNLIPGHGGLLDRVDSYLLALPVFAAIMRIGA